MWNCRGGIGSSTLSLLYVLLVSLYLLIVPLALAVELFGITVYLVASKLCPASKLLVNCVPTTKIARKLSDVIS